jgi:cell division protein FtsL
MSAHATPKNGGGLWLTMILVVAVIASAFSVIYAKHYNRQLFIEFQQLQNQRDELNIQYGQLQIEQSMRAADNELERVAAMRLDMTLPVPKEVVMIKP